jgi:endo-1,4-beta-xylanase
MFFILQLLLLLVRVPGHCFPRAVMPTISDARRHRPVVTFREAASTHGLLVGAAVRSGEFGRPDPLLLDPKYGETLSSRYNMIEAENAMKWNAIHPAPNKYDFAPADRLVAFAQTHGMKVRGHNLCWNADNPGWVRDLKAAAPPLVAQTLHDHIFRVVTHYRGKVFAWDVVNEAFDDKSPRMKDSVWYNHPGIGLSGTGYVEQAFRWAHAADPDALLFYNDYNIEAPGTKFQAVLVMLRDFVARGVPIHGVGIQMHLDNGSSLDAKGLASNIAQLMALGLQVHITELDVRVPVDAHGNASHSELLSQAEKYQQILTVCMQSLACTAFQTWGFTDKYSWIPGHMEGYGAALPFDTAYRPKPAFRSMMKVLSPPSLP